MTQDAKDAKTADFIVNMKEPIAEKEVPAVGSELKLLKEAVQSWMEPTTPTRRFQPRRPRPQALRSFSRMESCKPRRLRPRLLRTNRLQVIVQQGIEFAL